jgi:hypothetical protein
MNDMVVMKFLVVCLRLVFIRVFYWFLCAGMCDFSSHYTCYSWTELAFYLHVNGDDFRLLLLEFYVLEYEISAAITLVKAG